MEILAWNADKQRLTAMDVESSKENPVWFERCSKESDIHRITAVNGGILIGKAGYEYPTRQIEGRH